MLLHRHRGPGAPAPGPRRARGAGALALVPRGPGVPLAVLVLVLALATAAGVGAYASADDEGSRAARAADLAADQGAGPVVQVAPVLRTASPPVALQVPDLRIDTSLQGLRVLPSGTLDVPADVRRAGWWADGPAPGDLGPAVLTGHLDGPAGAGIFARLSTLDEGDVVDVRRADGTTARFTVREVVTYAKRDFPTARVYAGDGTAQLRLITCGGDADARSGRYRSNTVVFADLTAELQPGV